MVIRHGVRSNLLSVRAENECLVTDIKDRTVAAERLPPTSAEDAVFEFGSTILRAYGLSEQQQNEWL